MFHHPIKASLDIASLTLAIGVITDHFPWILGVPSFIYASIQLTEWLISKFKKK